MGHADYYLPGGWNAQCDRCGRKFKNSELRKDWRGMMVCERDYETRQPQDFVRPLTREGQIPWSRPKPALQFVLQNYTLLHDGSFPRNGSQVHSGFRRFNT